MQILQMDQNIVNFTKSLRTERQPHIVSKERRISTYSTDDDGMQIMKAKYTILSSSNVYDALELAEECAQLWTQYMEEMR